MITTSADWSEVKFNGTDIAQVNFNGVKVWQKGPAQGIYGVKAARGSYASTTGRLLTRTDDAVNFTATAYMNDGNTPGSSSFDNVMPWSGMVKQTLAGNVYVKIPKFWYQIEQGSDGYDYIRIANYAAEGFTVSPAHRARDGHGEVNYVYIGRYQSNGTDFSVSGATKNNGKTRAQWRALFKAGNPSVAPSNPNSLMDISMVITIRLLYLVEYANWDSTAVIGDSRGGPATTGGTDSMPYHTGTTGTVRTYAANVNTQYRNIEECFNLDAVDGIFFTGANGYVWDTTANFVDANTGGTNIGTRVKNTAPRVQSPGFRGWPVPTSVSGKSVYGALMIPDATAASSNNNWMGYEWIQSNYSDSNIYVCGPSVMSALANRTKTSTGIYGRAQYVF